MGEGGSRRTRHIAVLAVTMGLLLLALPLLGIVGGFATIASDACSSRPSLPICSPQTQGLVAVLPVGGGVVGLLVGVLGGVLAIRHHRRPYPWIVLGLVVAVAGLVTAVRIASTEPGATDSTTAQAVRPAPTPAAPRAQKWTWHPPGNLTVGGVEPAGAGVVVAVEDGVVALDGVTGRERWHYRTPGDIRDHFAVSPNGELVTISYPGQAHREERLVTLNAMTGEVVLDRTDGRLRLIEPDTVLTDHALVTTVDTVETELVGIDPRTGGHRWTYPLPVECELLADYPNPVATAGVVTVGWACGVDEDPTTDPTEESRPLTVTVVGLDARTGEQRWRLSRDEVGTAELASSGDGSVIFLRCDGLGELVDTTTGATVLSAPRMTKDNFIDATPEWLASRDWPNPTAYALTTVDNQGHRRVTPSEPRAGSAPTEFAATDRQLLMILHDSESDYHAVLVHPWTAPPNSSIEIPLRHTPTNADYTVVPAPGALVVATTDSTSVFGLT